LTAKLVKGVEEAARKHHYHVLLAHDHGDLDLQVKLLKDAVEMRSQLKGIIVDPNSTNISNPKFIEQVRLALLAEIKVVFARRYIPEVDVPCVMTDDYHGMYRLVEHLIMSGRRKLGFLTFGSESGVADWERRRGFYQATRDYSITDEQVLETIVGPASV
jgi:DNA-binding LacI/PurR family transcriptional regulator